MKAHKGDMIKVHYRVSLLRPCLTSKIGFITVLKKYLGTMFCHKVWRCLTFSVMWQGKLTDGTVFDSSFERDEPFEFELGSGQVIKGWWLGSIHTSESLLLIHILLIPPMVKLVVLVAGWDQGLLGACVGEKRKLKIPAKLGYGEQGSPPTIPGI